MDPRAIVAGLQLDEPLGPGRPRVVAAMIATADGHAQIDGRSSVLGNPADRELFRELRTAADAILVGARTLEIERYAELLDAHQREHRTAAGRPVEPIVATVSRRLDIDRTLPLLNEPTARVRVYTEADGEIEGCEADVSTVRFAAGELTIPAILADLAGNHGVRGVTCEGGPRLLREVVAQDCLDALMLTIAPMLTAGDALNILSGPLLPEIVRLAPQAVHRGDEHLFLHYAVTR